MLDDLLAGWLEEVVRPILRPRTHQIYSDIARLHLVPSLGALSLPDLLPEHVRQLYAALLARGLAPKTVRSVHGVLHGALHQAVGWQLVPRNVARMLRPPRVPKEIAILDIAQVQRLLATAKGGRWAAQLTLALATGMRQGELLGLRWGMSTSTPGSCGCSGS